MSLDTDFGIGDELHLSVPDEAETISLLVQELIVTFIGAEEYYSFSKNLCRIL